MNAVVKDFLISNTEIYIPFNDQRKSVFYLILGNLQIDLHIFIPKVDLIISDHDLLEQNPFLFRYEET